MTFRLHRTYRVLFLMTLVQSRMTHSSLQLYSQAVDMIPSSDLHQ